MRSLKWGCNEAWKKMMKEGMENVSFLAESMVKKQRENIEEIGTTSSLHHTWQVCDHHTRGHPNCLAVYVVKKLYRKTESSIYGVELKQKKVPPNLYAIHAKCVSIIPEDIHIPSQYPWCKTLQGRK